MADPLSDPPLPVRFAAGLPVVQEGDRLCDRLAGLAQDFIGQFKVVDSARNATLMQLLEDAVMPRTGEAIVEHREASRATNVMRWCS